MAISNEADAAGASERQLELLREAATLGRVPLESVQEAVDNTIACFDDNGVAHTEVTYEPDEGGLLHPIYLFGPVPGLSSDESYAVAQECIKANSDFIYAAYCVQPIALEAEAQLAARAKPFVIQCLRDNGISIDDDAIKSEMDEAALTLLLGEAGYRQLIESGGAEPQPSPIGPDCIATGFGQAG
jgi:hypothetical protein